MCVFSLKSKSKKENKHKKNSKPTSRHSLNRQKKLPHLNYFLLTLRQLPIYLYEPKKQLTELIIITLKEWHS